MALPSRLPEASQGLHIPQGIEDEDQKGTSPDLHIHTPHASVEIKSLHLVSIEPFDFIPHLLAAYFLPGSIGIRGDCEGHGRREGT